MGQRLTRASLDAALIETGAKARITRLSADAALMETGARARVTRLSVDVLFRAGRGGPAVLTSAGGRVASGARLQPRMKGKYS
jgi:hypothetical protein